MLAPQGLVAASYSLTLPIDAGSAGQVLSTDGVGNLSWIAVGGGITWSTPVNASLMPDVADTYALGDEIKAFTSVWAGIVAFGTSAADNFIYLHNDLSTGGYHLYFPADNGIGALTNDGAGNLSWASNYITPNSTTVGRPVSPVLGQQDFDTTLGIPIWFDGANWVNALGTLV
jgi:hypothetical protein